MTNKNLPPTAYRLQPKTYHLEPNCGFAMLFSVLISSLLVVVGLSIFNLTLKELTISTAARESQAAFYAAHAGLECALYWDNPNGIGGRETAFAISTGDYTRVDGITPEPQCNGVNVNDNHFNSGTKIITSTSNIQVTNSNGSCVDITVSKEPDPLDPSKIVTTIESRGKNICGASGRKVERGLRADYKEL